MMQTLNPSSTTSYPSKTDEIMSRYRPIAPKPELPNSLSSTTTANGGGGGGSLVVPEKFRQSPYLRNIWSHLQARPTRTRKRAARSSGPIPPSILRKHHHHNTALCSPSHLSSPSLNLSYQGFAIYDNYSNNIGSIEKPIVTLPLLSASAVAVEAEGERKSIDLNSSSAATPVLEETDLLLQLQVPNNNTTTPNMNPAYVVREVVPNNNSNQNGGIISPRPMRPVGSTISVVGPMSDDPAEAVLRTAEEVEEAAEAEALPVVISDRNNKVRMANWAYKELVGQPECPWLADMTMRSISSSGKRIGGEVMIHLPTEIPKPGMGNGFSCWVRIEWEREGKKSGVNAFCNVVKLVCDSNKDFMFSWRFHTREVSPTGSKI